MKLSEIKNLNEDRLDEINLKKAVVAGLLATTALMPSKIEPINKPQHSIIKIDKQISNKDLLDVASKIMKKYDLDEEEANHYVALAKKYEKSTWPKAKDILAVIGVESSFNPDAISKLKKDPARGLMQVRPKVWGISTSSLNTPEQQIKVGSEILSKYYDKLGNAKDALHAYNIGITNFKKQKNLNPHYSIKVEKELSSL